VLVLNLILIALLIAAYVVVRRLQHNLLEADQRRVRELETQRETFAAAAQAERDRLEIMLDAMIEGLVVIDTTRRMVLANRAAEKMFGFSRMMAGGSLLEATRHHEVATLARRAVVETEPIEHEVRIERPQPRILLVSAVGLNDRKGARTGAVLVFHDVTRLRQLEAVRQDFVANVSHELRTPLSLIRTATETLIDGGKNDPAITARFLEIIDKHASRLTLLIDDLLLLARLDSGRVELGLQRIPLRDTVQESLDDDALIARGRGVSLANEVPGGLIAYADPVRLRQVLGNLVENAIKYGRAEGNVGITARLVSGGMIEVAISDDGPGIPEEARDRIFERFYRVDKARSREQGGTGLGLAIVKNVVQAHGGDVRVQSALGKGTTFFFTIPAADVG
jgi:two-component system phosphate regulon sensor histidine kinase PhoR